MSARARHSAHLPTYARRGFSKKDNAVTAAARTLPILDLGRFASAHLEREHALAELRDVSRTLGFFYLAGHGI
nr:2-oxoglutarate and iron-dependent oxygenase domain-containing protein [Rhizobium sp. WYCCWR 11146]